MKIITVKIPRSYVEEIDRLVREGLYTSRSEFVRTALRLLLMREYEKRSRAPGEVSSRGDEGGDLLYVSGSGSHKRIVVTL